MSKMQEPQNHLDFFLSEQQAGYPIVEMQTRGVAISRLVSAYLAAESEGLGDHELVPVVFLDATAQGGSKVEGTFSKQVLRNMVQAIWTGNGRVSVQ